MIIEKIAFKSKPISFLISISIALLTFFSLSILSNLTIFQLFLTNSIVFIISFFLFYLVLEYVVLIEINKINLVLDKIKKKELKLNLKNNIQIERKSPKKIHEELYSYVTEKQDQIDELKKLEVFRREFIADISHELKTPIFASQGFIHTLLDGAIDDKNVAEKFLKKAANSLDGLEILVEHLLTLSQLETGEIKMSFERVDIISIIKEVIEQLENRAKKKDYEIKLLCNDNHIWVTADSFRIKHVFQNLIENAIKYGNEKGKVTIECLLDKNNYIFHIKDNGPGISPDHLARIFERFYRIDKSRSKEGGGSGLGLSIVQKIIENHNSKIMVTSKVGSGSDFIFKLKRNKLND